MTKTNPHDYNIQTIICPVCSFENANAITHELDIPYYDDFVSVSINCPKCKYRVNDFYNLKIKDHVLLKYKIETEQDFTTKVVRSVNGIVRIPELGITIDPVGEGSSWIRNIEGILEDIKNKLIISLKQYDDKNDKRQVKSRIKKLKRLKNNEIPFVIEVEDPSGNSLILPANEDKLEKKIIEKEE